MKQPIHMISGPRNMSTAIMYAFAQHPELEVIDEPFYAIYLRQTGKDHPGKEAVLAGMPNDLPGVLSTLKTQNPEKRLFIKNMAHHLGEVSDYSWITGHAIVQLVRHPARMVTSLRKIIATPTIQDLGLRDQYLLFEQFRSMGLPQLVVDSEHLLENPAIALGQICAYAGIDFSDRMLQWPEGPKPYDGLWAPWWYSGVHKTTGFAPQPTTSAKVSEADLGLYEEALHYYELMMKNR
jgi:hypothetical protein